MTESVAATINLLDVDRQLQQSSPQAILEYAFKEFDKIAISFSGSEDVALVDMASKIRPGIDVFCLDTGRLHPETYEFIDKIRKYYDVTLKVLFPDAKDVQELIAEKGLFSFYKDDHKECCGIRKVAPLSQHLLTLDAWITGQRKDQSPTRNDIPVVEDDLAFARPNDKLTKFNPLANWSSAQVWDYIRTEGVLFNSLHERGFISIGCEPCTKPILPGQHEREGRWWWEEATQKECGLHATQNLDNDASPLDEKPVESAIAETESSKNAAPHAFTTEDQSIKTEGTKITLVKKILKDGSPCKKCADVIERLEAADQMQFIDEIIIADERDDSSPGMLLAKQHKVDRAPFFIVSEASAAPKIYTVYMKFVKEVLNQKIDEKAAISEMLENDERLNYL